MADDAEKSVDTYELHLDSSLKEHAYKSAKSWDPGFAGCCDMCGKEFSRVVERNYRGERVYACGGCRDNFKMG